MGTLDERRRIADDSGLNLEQVKNWFKNRRKRESDKLGIPLLTHNFQKKKIKIEFNEQDQPRLQILPRPPSIKIKIQAEKETENSPSGNELIINVQNGEQAEV